MNIRYFSLFFIFIIVSFISEAFAELNICQRYKQIVETENHACLSDCKVLHEQVLKIGGIDGITNKQLLDDDHEYKYIGFQINGFNGITLTEKQFGANRFLFFEESDLKKDSFLDKSLERVKQYGFSFWGEQASSHYQHNDLAKSKNNPFSDCADLMDKLSSQFCMPTQKEVRNNAIFDGINIGYCHHLRAYFMDTCFLVRPMIGPDGEEQASSHIVDYKKDDFKPLLKFAYLSKGLSKGRCFVSKIRVNFHFSSTSKRLRFHQDLFKKNNLLVDHLQTMVLHSQCSNKATMSLALTSSENRYYADSDWPATSPLASYNSAARALIDSKNHVVVTPSKEHTTPLVVCDILDKPLSGYMIDQNTVYNGIEEEKEPLTKESKKTDTMIMVHGGSPLEFDNTDNCEQFLDQKKIFQIPAEDINSIPRSILVVRNYLYHNDPILRKEAAQM
ncbi:MAG: hypothetical protein PUP46_08175 [Endozoicomonas sp. (ex Botrylloides leachii)]|nr:hypothetical protein [Endozoicomonas sp. (ex Botrylloides leachii)]